MLLNDMHVRQVKRDREREIRERARDREHLQASQSVRVAIGRSIIAIGHRIAAEPQPKLARS